MGDGLVHPRFLQLVLNPGPSLGASSLFRIACVDRRMIGIRRFDIGVGDTLLPFGQLFISIGHDLDPFRYDNWVNHTVRHGKRHTAIIPHSKTLMDSYTYRRLTG